MKISFRELWRSRAPRERAALLALAAMSCIVLYLSLVLSTSQARNRLKAGMPVLKSQATRLARQAAEYDQLRNMPPPTDSKIDLRLLIQAQAEAAGLSQALTRIDVADGNRVQLAFDKVPFAKWLAWISALQSLHVRLDACRIEASSQQGWVNVTATFARPLSS